MIPKARHLVILHAISMKPRTVYSMSIGDVGVITGATEMGIHHACKSLEANGLIRSKAKRSGPKTLQIKSVTKAGKDLLESMRTVPVKTAPVSLCDLYVLDCIKNSPEVHEALICLLERKKAKAESQVAKDWYQDAINRYSKAL